MLAALAPPSPTAAAGTWPRLARRGLKRPRGLWKARRRVDPAATPSSSGYTPQGSPAPRSMSTFTTTTTTTTTEVPVGGVRAQSLSSSSWRGSDTDREEEGGSKERESGADDNDGEVEEDDEDEDDMLSEHSGSSKRQRRESADSSGSNVEMWAFYVDAADAAPSTTTTPLVPCAPPPQLELYSQTLIQDMVTTSIAERATPGRAKEESFEYEEWEGVKGTLRRACELYDGEDLSGSIALLRAVVHECHRLRPDPSAFPRRRASAIDRTMCTCTLDSFSLCQHRRHHLRHSSTDSPTALHAILGLALFLFGNLIAQNPSLAISREPTAPDFYWRAALDVFDAGDNLPSHTAANNFTIPDHSDDWRMPIAWGRTLLALAYDLTNPKRDHPHSSPPSPSSPSSPLSPSYQRFAQRSPLTAIAAMRTPGFALPTHTSPHELLMLAADQFSRGIFHMPHSSPGVGSSHSFVRARAWGPPPSPSPFGFSRPSELFTLALEVLLVAERLDGAEDRRRWAAWADAVFHQMHMEADVDTWRARVVSARGRCWLAIGSARADELEDALERGDKRVLSSNEAEEARTALATAISFFDRAKGSASTDSSETSLADMQPLLAEALLSLANLTADEDAREALYARAKAEGGEAVARDLGPSPTRTPTADVRMDES